MSEIIPAITSKLILTIRSLNSLRQRISPGSGQKNIAMIPCCCRGTRAKPVNRIRMLNAAPVTNRPGLPMLSQEVATWSLTSTRVSIFSYISHFKIDPRRQFNARWENPKPGDMLNCKTVSLPPGFRSPVPKLCLLGTVPKQVRRSGVSHKITSVPSFPVYRPHFKSPT